MRDIKSPSILSTLRGQSSKDGSARPQRLERWESILTRPTWTRAAAIVLVGATFILTSACGFILTQAPPQDHERLNYFTCTEGNAGPIVDLVWGGLNVLGAMAAASDPYSYDNPGQIEAVGIAWGIISGSAAVVGFGKTSRCRAAKRQLAERQAGAPGIPALSPDSAVAAVTIAPSADTLHVGQRVQLMASANNSAGQAIASRSFAWSSSNDAIASVNSAGQVTANAVGSVVIAARTGSVVGIASIVVVPPR